MVNETFWDSYVGTRLSLTSHLPFSVCPLVLSLHYSRQDPSCIPTVPPHLVLVEWTRPFPKDPTLSIRPVFEGTDVSSRSGEKEVRQG